MAVKTSGPISLLDLQNEFGGNAPIDFWEYFRGNLVRADIGASPSAFYEYPDGGRTYNVQVPANGPIQLSEFYGTTAVAPVQNYNWASPGTYTIPGSPGVSAARITIVGGGGGGGGGGHGGDGDSAGASGGGGGGGGGGDSRYGIVHFPSGTGLTIVVGSGGPPGQRGLDWRLQDGTWLYGDNGSTGGPGEPTRVYDVNGKIIASITGGQGGGGGAGGDRTNNLQSAGGSGGAPNGSQGQASQIGAHGYSTQGNGGAAGGPNGGNGGQGGPGVGLIGENGDQSAPYRGSDGNWGGSGSAFIEFGQSTGAPDIVVSSMNVTASSSDNVENTTGQGSAFYYIYFNSAVNGGQAPYTYSWRVISNPSNLALSLSGQPSARVGARVFGNTENYWTATLEVTVTDATGSVGIAQATGTYSFTNDG